MNVLTCISTFVLLSDCVIMCAYEVLCVFEYVYLCVSMCVHVCVYVFVCIV